MASTSAYYSSEDAVLQRQIHADLSKIRKTLPEHIADVYEIERCVNYIKEHRCKKVGLQFPDSLLLDASSVLWELEQKCNAKVYILADTSYGHCDIDEVNANHIGADLIIHYGESSLSQSAAIRTLFVFGQCSSNIQPDDVITTFKETYPVKETTRVVFLHHVTCHHIADKISHQLIYDYPYLSIGQLNVPTDPGGSHLQDGSTNNDILKELCTKSCPGCTCRTGNAENEIGKPKDGKNGVEPVGSNENSEIKSSNSENGDENMDTHEAECKDYFTGFYKIPLESDKQLSDYSIFYLGPKDSQSLQNLMLSHPSCEVHVYDPSHGYEKLQTKVSRQLMKRFYLTEKAKDAKIVGILVGTMGVAGYLEGLNYMKKLAKYAGKKTYTFIMGKLTAEKLANFLEIDIYVLVSNPEHSILDSSNFYRPVITPYEFDVACNPNREWTANYITDFRQILPSGSAYVALPANPREITEEPTMSLVSGGIRANMEVEEDPSAETDAIALRNDKSELAVFGNNSSAHRLSERSWKGLEQNIGKTAVRKAKKGRSGVATSYNEMMEF